MKNLLLILLFFTSFNLFSQTNQVCFISNFSFNVGPCDTNDTFDITGTIDFSGEPATGTLTITDVCSGMDTTINAPFTSPQTWGIHNIPTSFQGSCNIVAVFSADTNCNITLNYNAPQPCNCVAQIGTFTPNISSVGTQNIYRLCVGENFTLTSNGDFVLPDSTSIPPPNPYDYNPGIGYLLYTCPPTIAVNPSSTFPNDWIGYDPCFVGFIDFGNSFSDINTIGAPTWAGPWIDNTVYVVPITFYDTLNYLYSHSNTNLPCYEMGQPYAIQYLPQINYYPSTNCIDSSITFTISGGLPQLDSSLFTASNLLPTNANFVNTTATDSGTIKINGLLNGDNYSFDITDTNGCTTTITGGPFQGIPNVTMTPFNPDTICQWHLPFSLNNGSPAGGTYYGIDVTDTTFNPTNVGTHTIYYTYTDTNNNCTGIDSAQIYYFICADIAEYENSKLSIHPNPVLNQLIIATNIEHIKLDIIDVTGKIVRTNLTSSKTIDVSDLASGIYYLKVHLAKNIITRKFVKQ